MLWNMKFHYFVHKSPNAIDVLSQIKLLHTTAPYTISLRPVLILLSSMRVAFQLVAPKRRYCRPSSATEILQ
jgi:hypothetical protein